MKTQKKFQSLLIVGDQNYSSDDLLKQLSSFEKIDINSPDLTTIEPTKNSISIDEVRNLKKFIFDKPISNNNRVVLIREAHMLTTAAQNSLLKLLEEPPAQAIIALATPYPKKLLGTITSRLVSIGSRDNKLDKTEKDNKTLEQALVDLELIEDYKSYMDNELKGKYQDLLTSLDNKVERESLENAIEKAQLAKKMIEANVNPKFVIINYLLQTKSTSKI